MTAILCGTVTLMPAYPSSLKRRSAAGMSAGSTSNFSYVPAKPRDAMLAACILGESEWATGCPMTANFFMARPV